MDASGAKEDKAGWIDDWMIGWMVSCVRAKSTETVRREIFLE
jgi:hypothetical protein